MSYSYVYDTTGIGVLLGLIPMVTVPMLVSIASYVLSSLGLYQLSQRRGIRNAWLAWIPVANNWILGSLSDQYRYVVRGQNRSKRKSLLTLGILSSLSSLIECILGIVMFVQIIAGAMGGYSEARMMEAVLGPIMGMMGVLVILMAISIAYAIIRYMALYDIYKSMDPSNCIVFLVLSIFLNVTEPFFLFFNRNKDLGMPPRRDTVFTAEPM